MSVLSNIMQSVLLCAAVTVLSLCGQGRGQTCLSGFPSYDDVTSNTCTGTSCTFQGPNNDPELRIFPMMMISCSGELQGLTVAGVLDESNKLLPELQIWRPVPSDSMDYNKLVTTSIPYQFPVGFASLSNNVLNCTLDTAASVVEGDILGILLPRNHMSHAKLRIYFTDISTPNHILPSTSRSTFTPPSTQVVYVQPLIYLHIKPAVDCGSPPSISDGSPGTPSNTTIGGTVTYSCTSEYTLSGMATVSCLASGNWSSLPTCTGPVSTTNTVPEVTSEATTRATDPLTTSEPETTTPLVDPNTTREEITTSTETNSTPPNTPPATSPDAGIPTTTVDPGPVPTTNTVSEVMSEATTGATDPLTTSEPEPTTPLVVPTTTREESITSTETNSTPPPATSPSAGIPTTTVDPGNINTVPTDTITAETPITTGEGTDTTAVDSTDGFTTSHLPTTTSTTEAVRGIGGQSGDATVTAGAAIGGVIALLLLALIVVLIVLYVAWNRKRKSFKSKTTEEVEMNPMIQLHNPTYESDGQLIANKSNSDSRTGMPVLENPNYDYASAEIEIALGDADYDDIVDDKATVSVNMGVYDTPVDGVNDYCPTPGPPMASAYETPVNTLQKGLSMPGGGQYEWGLVVPSQETRTKALSLKSQTTETGEGIYAAIGMSQYGSGGPAPKFFEECETYWAPSSNANELYQQLSTKKYREILRPQIQLTDFLGAGAFGTVNKGLWQSPAGAMRVAIKTIQNKDEAEKVKFLQEAAIMGQFRHPNVVKLIGVVTVGEPVMIVLELLDNGDLRGFLNKQQPAPGEMVPSGTPQLLLKFCQHISCGMEYLARKAFVHRDLAARNILVAEDKTCKISDFGMSRDLMDENYYVSHGGKVPVKWTAPEAINYKKYSTASDVWSFGCVMYEIWSLGHKPFEGYTNSETIRKVDKGHRLPPPPGCPREIYKFMIECWHPDRSRRPSFAQLVEMLSQADFEILYWQDADSHGHPQAMVVGAPLEAGEKLYLNLQQAYLPASNNQ